MMGGNEAKRLVLEALRENNFRHEPRDATKNLLASRQITIEEAIEILSATKGQEMEMSPHHQDRAVSVWVFRPKGWYVKFFFRTKCWFISFHREAQSS